MLSSRSLFLVLLDVGSGIFSVHIALIAKASAMI
jgi:hypothetical protein